MTTLRITGCILTPAGWVQGTLEFAERIIAIDGEIILAPNNDECWILPGFIDLHVHGGGGADVMDGGDAIEVMARLHARHGTTSLLATTMSASPADLERALIPLGRAVRQRPTGAARVLGVHLEGPFIDPHKAGAQPLSAVRRATLAELAALQALAPIRILTLAPELNGHLDFIRAIKTAGILPQLGHSNGTYEDAVAALAAGATGFTHLFNAMSPLHHRQPGLVGAALAHAEYAELIPDLLHVHPGAIHAARRAIPKLFGVTDATAAAGMPDGAYHLGSQPVSKCLGGVRLADGTLAGSALTMAQAFRNLLTIGLSPQEAACRLATYPADYLGETARGRLQPGAHADMVVFSPQWHLLQCFIEGEAIEPVNA